MNKTIGILTAGFVLVATPAFASIEQLKIYKEAFPDAKPKCMACHLDAVPKKDAGKHELNAYGKEAVKLAPQPTAETYKTLGPAESFVEKK